MRLTAPGFRWWCACLVRSLVRSSARAVAGTCSIYDPPFSFWCSSPPFSAGCGGCFTWNIPAGIAYPAAMLKRYDREKLVSNGKIVAWRAAHWANWCATAVANLVCRVLASQLTN
eukprot:SAG22_NODE_237_length_14221_cov_37.207832_14_plen_115_part_00